MDDVDEASPHPTPSYHSPYHASYCGLSPHPLSSPSFQPRDPGPV
jgi:hypothetical protein